MDQTAAPWRALEDEAPAAGNGPSASAASAPASATRPRPTWFVAAVVAAAVVAGAAIWLVATSGSGTLVVEGDGPGPGRSDRAGAHVGGSPASAARANLVVDVQGAVVRPGIVHLSAGARVADAIAAAGGYGPRVAADRVGQALNLAALVKDGDKVFVPSRDDRSSSASSGSGGSGGSTTGGNGPVDLNRATVAELDALPGIGPVTAAKIIAARDEQAFGSVDDLRTRKILGAATFDKVKNLVVVR
jgi:competence protein ComEA